MPDLPTMHIELRRKGMTLQLLHEEYLAKHADGYAYTQFCEHYRRYKKSLKRSMRQTHKAGEKLFLDFAGPKIPVVESGEASIYVAVLGTSNYTFACATPDQTTQSWVGATTEAFEFIGGVTEIAVPDCPKAVVTKACPYDPVINRSIEDMARHYGCSIIPARPGRPQDKAKVEVGVQVVERWILARLRKRTFMTLAELNDAIGELIGELNNRPFTRLPGTRAELFASLDVPALSPLPARRYKYATWKDQLTVSTDYHVALHLGERCYHYYSVPHALVGRKVNLRLTANLVEIFHGRKLVASHLRDDSPGQATTEDTHMPKAHQRFKDWTPRRIRSDAAIIGPSCRALVDHILASKPHPEQGFRACRGIIRLRRHGDERLEAACALPLPLRREHPRKTARPRPPARPARAVHPHPQPPHPRR
jgi:transposase